MCLQCSMYTQSTRLRNKWVTRIEWETGGGRTSGPIYPRTIYEWLTLLLGRGWFIFHDNIINRPSQSMNLWYTLRHRRNLRVTYIPPDRLSFDTNLNPCSPTPTFTLFNSSSVIQTPTLPSRLVLFIVDLSSDRQS